MTEQLTTLNNNEALQQATPTEEWYNAYIAYIDASPRTIEAYGRALKYFLQWLSENGITHPQREDIIRYRDELKENHKPTTVQNYIMALRQFFNWTEQEKGAYYYPNVANHIKGAKLNHDHKKDYLTTSQIHLVLDEIEQDSLKGLRDYAILLLMITNGLRTIEVSRANIEDLATLDDNTVLYIQGKGKEEKTDIAIIAPPTEKAIRAYLKERGNTQPDAPLFAGTSHNNGGGRMTTRAISGTVKERLRAVGLDSDRLTAHSLRHTAITLALKNGMSLQEASQFARHASIATTDIYAHNLDRNKNKCSRTIAAALFK